MRPGKLNKNVYVVLEYYEAVVKVYLGSKIFSFLNWIQLFLLLALYSRKYDVLMTLGVQLFHL